MNWTSIFSFAAAGFHFALAAVVVWRGAENLAKRSFVAGMLVFGIENLFIGLSFQDSAPENLVTWQRWRLAAMAALPGVWLLFSETFSRKNKPKPLYHWSRLAWALSFVPLILAAGFPDLIFRETEGGSAEGNRYLALLYGGYILMVVFLLSGVWILMNLERTFRASVGIMRWRIKYMILGVGTLWVIRVYSSSQALIYTSVPVSLDALNAGASLIGCLLIGRASIRTGHFNVDVYPSQAVLRNSLTAVLAGVYLVIVGVLARTAEIFGGVAGFPLKAFLILVALVVLAMLLLSDQVQQATQRFVSRHFRRPIHDYRKVWTAFTARTASRTQEPELCKTVVELITDTFQVLSVTLLLIDKETGRLRFGASTSFGEDEMNRLMAAESETEAFVDAMRHREAAVDLDAFDAPWVESLKRLHPDFFGKGGNRLCISLVAGDRLLGLLFLGDRIGGIRFVDEDFDLLKSVADHIAGNLLNLQLSRELLHAKEMEAFQTMSSFFVHDLKNTASTLSLMLRNFREHFDDPDFREDALRAVSKSVTRINELIQRLSLVRQTLSLHPEPTDLNQLVAETLSGLDASTRERIVCEPECTGTISLDPGQIQKVLTNLVLNARDAIPPEGNIRIKTQQQNGWAVLSVSDNGCGIDPDYLRQSLFRPFRTTKKNGIGIGMFHSKKIVEAHHGRIDVESEPGKGTTFRVCLPLKGTAH